jgi:hypothetical protein
MRRRSKICAFSLDSRVLWTYIGRKFNGDVCRGGYLGVPYREVLFTGLPVSDCLAFAVTNTAISHLAHESEETCSDRIAQALGNDRRWRKPGRESNGRLCRHIN